MNFSIILIQLFGFMHSLHDRRVKKIAVVFGLIGLGLLIGVVGTIQVSSQPRIPID